MMKKRVAMMGVLAVLLALYLARVLYLNRDLEKSRVTYVPDTESVTYDGMKVSVTEQVVYEMPAFVETHPGMEEYYHISTNLWAQSGDVEGFRSLKYVVGVKLAFHNVSEKKKEIELSAFRLSNKVQTIAQGADPYQLETLNGAVLHQIAPGETKEVFLNYDLFGAIIQNLNEKKVLSEDFSVTVSGYPDMKAIRLGHLSLVRAKGEFDPFDWEEQPAAQQVKKDDTPSGTILPIGGECVTGGVGVKVESVDIVQNVKEFPNYQGDAWRGYFKRRFLKKDGTVTTIWEDDHGLPTSYYKKGYENYIIFVTLRFRNYTNQTASIYNVYGLYDGKASWDCPSDAEYTSALLEKDEEDASQGVIRAGADQVLVLGYARSVRKDQDIRKMPLYISNDAVTTEYFDLEKGKCGFGKFIRIQ